MTQFKKQNLKYDNVPIGLIFGFVLPFLVYIVVWLLSDTGGANLYTYFQAQKEGKILTNVVSLCTLSNLGLFFFFLKKNYYNSVRGVILSVFLIAFWVVLTKYII